MRLISSIAAVLVLVAAAPLSADTVRLRSGKTIQGQFLGGDSKSVRVLLDNGQVSEIPLEQAVAVEFTVRKPPPPSPPPAAKPAAAAPSPKPEAPERRAVTVPAGTALNVRLVDQIDVDASKAGMTFKAVIDDPVMLGGAVVIPRGASATLQAVQVQQSGTMKGSDKISLKLNSFRFGGMVYEVTTAYVETKGKGEGKKTARKVGGGAGLGAIVGGIAGGGSGAAIGAAVGGATGAVVASAGEEHLTVPAETRLQFQLTAAVTVQPVVLAVDQLPTLQLARTPQAVNALRTVGRTDRRRSQSSRPHLVVRTATFGSGGWDLGLPAPHGAFRVTFSSASGSSA